MHHTETTQPEGSTMTVPPMPAYVPDSTETIWCERCSHETVWDTTDSRDVRCMECGCRA